MSERPHWVCNSCGAHNEIIAGWDGPDDCCWKCGAPRHLRIAPEQEKTESIEDLQSSPKRIISSIPGFVGESDHRIDSQCGVLKNPTTSQTILQQAQETITGRDLTYGHADDVLGTSAELFGAYMGNRNGEFDARDIAIFNILQKIARISHGQNHKDNWVDIAGYAALGAEVDE